ncbi:MAG: hypothetical protein IJD10_07050 [Clostridia bacterium]|nr:hypothetical protein [Clostridia bacterium]
MMNYDFRLPKIPDGSDHRQLEQIKRYLYQVGEHLTYAMNALNIGETGSTASGAKIHQEDIKVSAYGTLSKQQAAGFREYEKDGWSVRQYNNGTVELWREYETSCSCNSIWGALWRGEGAIQALPFPVIFDAAPHTLVTAHGVDSPYFLVAENASALNQTGSYSIVSAEEKETIGVHISFYVRGKVSIEEESI